MFLRLAGRLLDLLVPRSCAACEATLAAAAPGAAPESAAAPAPATAPLCPACLAALPPAMTIRIGDLTVDALTRHAGPARELVHALKYEGRRDVARYLGRRARGLAALEPGAVLVPIPLHPRRELSRGYNQSALLAAAVAAAAPGLAVEPALARRRSTRSQTRLDRAARATNVAGCFALRRRSAARLSGRAVILVDDVVTTGATLEAAALALTPARPRSVAALVAARAEVE